MPKIVLVALNSSFTHTNLGVRCIKKELCELGYDCTAAEFNLKDKRRYVLEYLVSAKADIYGFSAYIWNIRELLGFADELKKLRPSSLVVFGGPEVSYDAEELLKDNPQIDCIIKGEGEAAFCRLAELYKNGLAVPPIIDGGIFENFEAQGSLYQKDELCGGSRVVYYESSRGCPFRCAYCLSAMSGKVRAKSAEVTLRELSDFEAVEHIKIIKLVDRTFNFDIERAKTIWRGLLSPEYTKNYHFEICADLLDEECFDILGEFPKGKIQLEIGVQSTNADTLRTVNRNPKTDKLLLNLERLYCLGNIHIHADLIAGLPREDFESFGRSFDGLYGKCHMLQLGFLKLLRGSKLREAADTFGCIYSDTPPYEVLSTDCLSYSEICKLHDIDDLNDRYGSGAFRRSMTKLMENVTSPFGFFFGLSENFRREGIRIGELSQPRAYEKLFEYSSDITDKRELAELLTIDFLTSQKVSPPSFGGIEIKRGSDETKRSFMRYADEVGIEYFAPALEVRCGGFEYVIDRRNMRAYKADKGKFYEI